MCTRNGKTRDEGSADDGSVPRATRVGRVIKRLGERVDSPTGLNRHAVPPARDRFKFLDE